MPFKFLMKNCCLVLEMMENTILGIEKVEEKIQDSSKQKKGRQQEL